MWRLLDVVGVASCELGVGALSLAPWMVVEVWNVVQGVVLGQVHVRRGPCAWVGVLGC